jgi:hypothetical protein
MGDELVWEGLVGEGRGWGELGLVGGWLEALVLGVVGLVIRLIVGLIISLVVRLIVGLIVGLIICLVVRLSIVICKYLTDYNRSFLYRAIVISSQCFLLNDERLCLVLHTLKKIL